MVYYSPYKQILRAFIRAVRTFISSLFSKRLLLMIIVALVIILLHLNVNAATTYEDGYAYRQVGNIYYNEDTKQHYLDYRVYVHSGVKEGTIRLGDYFFNNADKWFLFLNQNGDCRIIVNKSSSDTFYIQGRADNFNTSNTPYRWSFTENGTTLINYEYWVYDSTNDKWSISASSDSSVGGQPTTWSMDWLIEPNGILYRNNMYVRYHLIGGSDTQNFSCDLMRNTPRLKTTNLKLTSDGFRLYLGDFYDHVYDMETFAINYSLSNVICIIKELNTSIEYIRDNDILSYSDVEQDSEGNYYIDLLFSDYLTDLHNQSGDYLICFTPCLNGFQHVNYFNTYKGFDTVTKFVTFDFYRYEYFASSGDGILKSVYEDGTEKPTQEEPETPEQQENNNTAAAIDRQTEKIEEQTNSINDMSNFMQDDSFSSDSITNNMPSSDEFQDVTESGFDNIFTTLRNTFTSDNYQDVEFVVPFSNGQKITIPSNLTENIIPTAIKTLIQMVYWYFIARFIVKDIASYIEKAKSGDIFSSSDTNIKTDML